MRCFDETEREPKPDAPAFASCCVTRTVQVSSYGTNNDRQGWKKDSWSSICVTQTSRRDEDSSSVWSLLTFFIRKLHSWRRLPSRYILQDKMPVTLSCTLFMKHDLTIKSVHETTTTTMRQDDYQGEKKPWRNFFSVGKQPFFVYKTTWDQTSRLSKSKRILLLNWGFLGWFDWKDNQRGDKSYIPRMLALKRSSRLYKLFKKENHFIPRFMLLFIFSHWLLSVNQLSLLFWRTLSKIADILKTSYKLLVCLIKLMFMSCSAQNEVNSL